MCTCVVEHLHRHGCLLGVRAVCIDPQRHAPTHLELLGDHHARYLGQSLQEYEYGYKHKYEYEYTYEYKYELRGDHRARYHRRHLPV